MAGRKKPRMTRTAPVAPAPPPVLTPPTPIAAASSAIVRQKVARALWRLDLAADTLPEERRRLWVEGRSDYTAKATRMLRIFQSEGLALSSEMLPDQAAA